MANLSNINGKFVVEQTTGYVGVGTTDPNYPIEVLNASAEIALNASGASIYRLKSDSTDAFRINKNGVGDRLIIAGNGNATFSGSITANTGSKITSSSTDTTFSIETTSGTTIFPILDFVSSHSSVGGQIRQGGTKVIGFDKSLNTSFAGSIEVGTGNSSIAGDLYFGVNADIFKNSGTLGINAANSNFSGNIILNNNQELQSKDTAGNANRIMYLDNGDTLVIGNPTTVDDIRFDVDTFGEGAMIIKSSGNVGIGTAGPNKTLELGYSNTEQNVLLNGLPGGAAGTGILVFNTDTTTNKPFANIDFRAGNADARIALQRDASNSASFHFITDDNNTFSTKMFIKHSGNVGIGTTSPSDLYADQLVVKCSSSENGITILSNSTTDANYLMFADGTSGNDRFKGQIKYNHQDNFMAFGTDAVEKMRITSDGKIAAIGASPGGFYLEGANRRFYGNGGGGTDWRGVEVSPSGLWSWGETGIGNYFSRDVGIGLSSPAAKLHVSGTSTQLMLETPNSTNDIDFRWRENGTNKWNIRYQNATEDLQILNQIGPTIVQMHFESSNAKVGIGNVNPTGRLTVEDESGNQLHLRNGNTASGRYWNFDVASDSKLYVVNQQGTGVYIAHGATSWTGTSDESLKENIKPLENVLDKIKDYRCVEYNLKSVPDDKKIGFIAQDWKNDFAPIVDKDNDGLLGIKYTETIPVLLKAIQELKAEIELLKNK